jgi:hypothetical protein
VSPRAAWRTGFALAPLVLLMLAVQGCTDPDDGARVDRLSDEAILQVEPPGRILREEAGGTAGGTGVLETRGNSATHIYHTDNQALVDIARTYVIEARRLAWGKVTVTCRDTSIGKFVTLDGSKRPDDEDWTAYLAVIISQSPRRPGETTVEIVIDAPLAEDGDTFDFEGSRPRIGEDCVSAAR